MTFLIHAAGNGWHGILLRDCKCYNHIVYHPTCPFHNSARLGQIVLPTYLQQQADD